MHLLQRGVETRQATGAETMMRISRCKLACLGVVKENDRLKSELLVLCEVIANLQPSGLCNLSIPAGYVTVLPCRNHFQCL